jgi:acetyl-CoA/propionyl-CoA carboxylase biotin carboxyl carrier protein
VTVRVAGSPDDARVTLDDGEPVRASARRTGKNRYLEATVAGRRTRYRRVLDGDTLWLASAGATWAVHEHSMLESESAAASVSGTVTSPMPGTVLVVKAAAGDQVTAGAPLVVVEAMKMEHTVTAPVDGVLTELHVRAGQQVALNQPLAVVTPQEEL